MNRKQFFWTVIIAFFIGALGSIVIARFAIPYLATFRNFSFLSKISSTSPIVVTRTQQVQLNEGVNLVDIAKQSGNITVNIYPKNGNDPIGKGIVVTSDGLIFTTQTSIASVPSVNVVLNDGRVFDASVRAVDRKSNLVVLSIQADNLTAAQFDNSSDLSAGQRIFALGTSFNSYENKFATGFVTDTVSDASVNSVELVRNSESFSQTFSTDMKLDSSFTGGPIIDLDGHVVGLVDVDDKYILSENIQSALKSYLDTGKITRQYLGITYTIVNPTAAKLLNLSQSGLKVASVEKGSPAELAGLVVGDLIVTADGQDLSSNNFEQILNQHSSMDLNLSVLRNNATKDIVVKLVDK
jgi:serine protease Do